MAGPPKVGKSLHAGDAGNIEIAAQLPEKIVAVAVVAHPHPLFGGTMDNKVVTTLARACLEAGAATYRFNFRGVAGSQGAHDGGRGETEDMLRVIAHAQTQHPGLPLWLSGFSFGGAVTLAASERVIATELILVAPSFQRLTQWQNNSQGAEAKAPPESTVIIHGERDDTVKLSDSLDWARPRNIPVIVVPDADHFFHQRLHIIRQIVARWLPSIS